MNYKKQSTYKFIPSKSLAAFKLLSFKAFPRASEPVNFATTVRTFFK